MVDLTRIPLAERIQSAQDGHVCQPEYLPALIRQWARMPIKAYFGPCKKELERLYAILGLKSDENPSYQDVAGMICDPKYALAAVEEEGIGRLLALKTPSGAMGAEVTELLAAPVRAWKESKKRGAANE